MNFPVNRGNALKSALGWAGATVLTRRTERAFGFTSANARPRIAAVETGSRGYQKATGLDSEYGLPPAIAATQCNSFFATIGDAQESIRGQGSPIPVVTRAEDGWVWTSGCGRAARRRDNRHAASIPPPSPRIRAGSRW